MAGKTFLRFNNPRISGSSMAKGHEGDVEVGSWGFGGTQPSSPVRSVSTTEKVQLEPLRFTKFIDKASDDLLKGLFTANRLGKVELICYRSSGDTGGSQNGFLYLTLELEGVIVSKYELNDQPDDIASEKVELSYRKISFTYHEYQGGGGPESIAYDLVRNEAN